MALNRGHCYRERIGPADAGRRVAEHLAASRPHSSADVWAARLEGGEVWLDGVPARAGDVLRAGQRLEWHRPPWDEPDVPLAFRVVHEDEALLAVDKPAGLPTMPAGGFLEHTLLMQVRRQWPEARPLHRLGRFTSGLVLFARTAPAAAALSAAWRAHAVRKVYRALAAGVARADRIEIDAPIGPVPHPALGSVHAAAADGQPAHSVAHVVERREDRTLFEVAITTGRPHQIRIHLAWAGHPLVGDPLYAAGGGLVERPGLPGDGGYLLHARQLTFVHPSTGTRTTIEVPPPALLRTAQDARP